jgi:MFS family permease
MKLSSSLVKSTIVASLGGLLFGFDTAVIAGTTAALSKIYSLSPLALGFTVASALCGTILGAMIAGIPGNRYGRRDSLRCMAVNWIHSFFCIFPGGCHLDLFERSFPNESAR